MQLPNKLKLREILPALEAGKNPKLDIKLEGINFYLPGFYLIGADSGAGKTRLCIKLIVDLLFQNKKIIYLCLEDSRENIIRRLLSDFIKIPFIDLMNNQLTQDQLISIKESESVFDSLMNNLEFHNWEYGDIKILEETFKEERYNEYIIFIDYLQLITASGRAFTDLERHQEIAKIIRFNIEKHKRTVIGLVQLNRSKEKGLSSVAGSSAYGYNANGLVLVERTNENETVIIPVKCRSGNRRKKYFYSENWEFIREENYADI
jgi:replicative DNA helicase